MPLEIYEISLNPEESATVTCQGDIDDFLVGLKYFYLYFSSGHHEVHRAGIHLQTSQSTSRDIQITAHIDLVGGSGQEINPSSHVSVVVLAWTGLASKEFELANANGIADGTSSGPIDVPGSSPTINQPLLSGFDLEYSGHHKIRTVHAGVGSLFSGDAAFITGEAGMSSDGADAETASVDGGLIFSTLEDPGFQVTNTGKLEEGTHTLEPGQSFTHFQPILTSFDLFFDNSAHEVRYLSAGITAAIDDQDDQELNLSVNLEISNGDGKTESDDSSLTGVVITWSDPDAPPMRSTKPNPSRKHH